MSLPAEIGRSSRGRWRRSRRIAFHRAGHLSTRCCAEPRRAGRGSTDRSAAAGSRRSATVRAESGRHEAAVVLHDDPPTARAGARSDASATVTQPVEAQSAGQQHPRRKSRRSRSSRFVPEEIVDVAVPEANAALRSEQPTLYVATGGVGIQVLCRLRALTAPRW